MVPAAAKDLEKQMARLESGGYHKLPPMPCPECGYIQSWNVDGARKRIAERVGGVQVALCEIGVDLHARSDTPAALAFWRAVGYDLASYRMREYPD